MRDLVRLKSQEGPFANGWLQVVPSDGNDTLLSSSDFSLLVRWWLGKGLLPQTGQLPACPLCSNGVVDPFGDHLVSCAKNGIGARHNLVRDALFLMCAQADIPVSRERSCEEGSRDADLLLHGWCKGRDAAWDVTIIHPCQHAAFPLNCTLAAKSLALAEKRKEDEGGVRCARHGWGFMGSAFTTWGMAGPNSQHVLGQVIKVATRACGVTRPRTRAAG